MNDIYNERTVSEETSSSEIDGRFNYAPSNEVYGCIGPIDEGRRREKSRKAEY